MGITARAKRYKLNSRLAEAIVRTVVEKRLSLFSSQRLVERDDLVFTVLAAVHREYPKRYDPEKSAPSTFIQTIAQRRILDALRKVTRRHEMERKFNEKSNPTAESHHDVSHVFDAEPEKLADRLGDICQRARVLSRQKVRLEGRRRGRPRYHYDDGQVIAMLMLMAGKNLSSRGLVLYLLAHPDICAAIRLSRIPNDGHIRRLKKSGAQFMAMAAAGLN